ncbi:MAG: AAA family ATPase [Neisseriaceae bacterium]|nr:AAA family ATPase [Neisseriaceae bacterium]
MRFETLELKNFRNFKDAKVNLANKNLIFGMNDVGKSNLIYALCLLFDSKIRNENILDSDFYQHKTAEPIVITCCLNINEDDKHSKMLRAEVVSEISSDSEKLYIQFKATSKGTDDHLVELFWGSDFKDLAAIPSYGVNRTKLDKLFETIYIPSGIELENTFYKLKKEILATVSGDDDQSIKDEINASNEQINKQIQSLTSVQEMKKAINGSLKRFDQQFTAEITSSQSVGDLYKHLMLYTQNHGDTGRYPTSGDGRQKKMMYAMLIQLLDLKTAGSKIPLLLIEEPENHLFLSAQVDLSGALFAEDTLTPFVFLTTHSPQLFYKISNDAQLIRLYRQEVQNESLATQMQSAVANFSEKQSVNYQKLKLKLLENLAHCLFVERVLLVEGPSEKLLFDAVLDFRLKDNPDLRQRIYVMPVMGAYFDNYWEILHDLGIKVFVKTDNDIQKSSATGLKRCIKLLNYFDKEKNEECIQPVDKGTNEQKKSLYQQYKGLIDEFKQHGIYLSQIDLEHDLAEVFGFDEDWVKNLQKKKWHHMYDWIFESKDGLTEDQMNQMVEHELFACLKDISA